MKQPSSEPPEAPLELQLPVPYRLIRSLTHAAADAPCASYEALDTQSNNRVSFKRLRLGRLTDWKRLELFEREARVLAQLNHPRLPRILAYHQVDTPEGSEAYLVSEWIEGISLAEKLAAGWNPDEPELLQLAEQALWLLAYLHTYHPPVIHRDLKPGNLILGPGHQLYLIDFGGVQELLYPVGGGGSTVIGTFGYMAPEQFAGRALPASDLYALGACLVHLLSGRAPVDLPQRQLQLAFQGYVVASPGFVRWLTGMTQPAIEARFADASSALAALYELTGLKPGQQPSLIRRDAPPALNMPLKRAEAAAGPADIRLEPGTMLRHYRIDSMLSQGSETTTYAASQLTTGQAVVIKALSLPGLRHWKSFELFEREIAMLGQLQHAGIPKSIEAFAEDENYYLVSERIEGHSLDRKLLQGWRPTEAETIELARQALQILNYLHSRLPPVIHRDLKPSNLLLDAQGRLHLIDFGGAKQRPGGSGGSTVIGTFGYIAPEEYLKRAVPATDLYSLGVTLVRLLSGREPTELPTRNLKLDFHEYVHCSPGLRNWLDKMLEPELGRRFASASQALASLEQALAPENAQTVSATTQMGTLPLPAVEARPAARLATVLALKLQEQRFVDLQLETLADDRLRLRLNARDWNKTELGAIQALRGQLSPAHSQRGLSMPIWKGFPGIWVGLALLIVLLLMFPLPVVPLFWLIGMFLCGLEKKSDQFPGRGRNAPVCDRELLFRQIGYRTALVFQQPGEPTADLPLDELTLSLTGLALGSGNERQAYVLALHHRRYAFPQLVVLRQRGDAETLAEALLEAGAGPHKK